MNMDIEQFAENLIRNEILCCDSALVERLFELDELFIENAENLTVDIDDLTWDVVLFGTNMPGYLPDSDPLAFSDLKCAVQCAADSIECDMDEYADSEECSQDILAEYRETIDYLRKHVVEFETVINGRAYWVKKDIKQTPDMPDITCQHSRWWTPFDDGFVCREGYSDSSDLVREPLEWWRITDSLARDLTEIGEVVLESDYGTWWGRTISGQAIIADGVMQRVAQHIESRISR